jgi:hypothetical protein
MERLQQPWSVLKESLSARSGFESGEVRDRFRTALTPPATTALESSTPSSCFTCAGALSWRFGGC